MKYLYMFVVVVFAVMLYVDYETDCAKAGYFLDPEVWACTDYDDGNCYEFRHMEHIHKMKESAKIYVAR